MQGPPDPVGQVLSGGGRLQAPAMIRFASGCDHLPWGWSLLLLLTVIGGNVSDILVAEICSLWCHDHGHAAAALTVPIGFEGHFKIGGRLTIETRVDIRGGLAVCTVAGHADCDFLRTGFRIAGTMGEAGDGKTAKQ